MYTLNDLDSLPDTYTYPEEQHDYVPKLSTILEADVDDKFYIADEKAHKIIDQALQRISSMGKVHATITPDRVDKRQNGRRSKEDEDPMFTLTAQDLHGVIVDDTYGYPTERERESRKRIYTEVAPTLRSSRQGVKVVEGKPKSYKTPAGYCLPYLEVSKFLKADTDKIYHDAYVSENGDFKKAVVAFRKYFAEKHRKAKAEMEKYDDFYRSCFKYTTPTGTVMVP